MTAEPLNYKREISLNTTIEFDEVLQTFKLVYRRTGLKFYYIELSHLAMESLIEFKRQIDLEVREWRLTPAEAAEIIGCSSGHVYTLIAHGKLKCWRKLLYKTKDGDRTVIQIPTAEAERYRDITQTVGYPRGRRRKKDRRGHGI